MTVFSTILKILNKLKGMLILYTGILIAITALNQTSDSITEFEESKPDLLIINEDRDDTVTKGFTAYLKEHCNIKNIDADDKEKIGDALFYRDVNYVLYIPENFGRDLLEGKEPSLEYKSTGDENAAYCQMIVEKYIRVAMIYKDYYEGEELTGKVLDVVENDTQIKLKTTLDTSSLSSMTRYFNFLNYALLAGCVYCISMILASLKEENVRKRTIISAFNYKKYNRIVLVSLSIVIMAMWGMYMLLSFILFKGKMTTPNGIAFMINSLVFALCCLCIGFFIGNITQSKEAIGGIVNVVALGTSFLCGCFVPFDYMPDYVIKIAHILPTYYFVINNETIKTIEAFEGEAIKTLLFNGGIVVAFAVMFIIITNCVSRKKQSR